MDIPFSIGLIGAGIFPGAVAILLGVVLCVGGFFLAAQQEDINS